MFSDKIRNTYKIDYNNKATQSMWAFFKFENSGRDTEYPCILRCVFLPFKHPFNFNT